MAFDKKDLKILSKYSKNRKNMLEIGCGVSTSILINNAKKYGSMFYSIDLDKEKILKLKIPIKYMKIGYSITYEDLIKPGEEKYVNFVNKRGKEIGFPFKREDFLNNDNDLLRKMLAFMGNVDFYFGDSGEFCGLAEWKIIKDFIDVGGFFLCHDIYYPKSIKNFQVYKEIKNDKRWKILKKTKSRQGLLVALRIK